MGASPESDVTDDEKSLGMVSTAYASPDSSSFAASSSFEIVHEKPAVSGAVSSVTSWRPASTGWSVPSGSVMVTISSLFTTTAGIDSTLSVAPANAPETRPATASGTTITAATSTP